MCICGKANVVVFLFWAQIELYLLLIVPRNRISTPFTLLLTTTVEMDPIGLPDDDGSTAAGAPGSEPPLQVSAKFPLYDDERKKS